MSVQQQLYNVEKKKEKKEKLFIIHTAAATVVKRIIAVDARRAKINVKKKKTICFAQVDFVK